MTSPVDPFDERLYDPAFEVRQSVVSELAGRVGSESRRIQQMLLRDRDRAVIEAMAEALIAMADVESLSLVSEALYNNDDDEGVWQTLAWSIKEAVDGGRSVVTQGLRKVAEIDSVSAREGALDVLDWLGLLTEEEVRMHPPFRGGYTIVKAGQSQEIRMIDASKVSVADFGDHPYLVARPFSLTTPECGIVYLVNTGVPGLDRLSDQDPNDEWTLAAASVTWDGKRSEMVSRNHVYRIAGRAEVESREVDWAFRCEWRVQRQDGAAPFLEIRETFITPERSPHGEAGQLVERTDVLRRDGDDDLIVVSSETSRLGPDVHSAKRLPVQMRKPGEISERLPALGEPCA